MATAPYQLPRYKQFQPGVVDASAQALDPNAMADSGGNPVYGNPAANPIPSLNLDPDAPIHNTFYDDKGQIQAGGKQINDETTSQLGYYGPIQEDNRVKGDQALEELKQMPGYTPGEAGQINIDYGRNKTGDPAFNSEFLTPGEQQSVMGDPSVGAKVADAGIANERAQMGNYAKSANGTLGAYGENLSGQLGNYANYTKSGLDTLGTGLEESQGKFSKLDEAVNNPALAFDPNSTEKQLSDADVQQMKTAAGTRVGNQYRSAEDDLARRAAAQGNTSPLAIAAANARLQHSSAADMGDAEVEADIAARQAQQDRAAQIEAQREGAVNTQTGYRAGAATTEQAQAQAAAGLKGTQAIQAGEAVGQAGLDTANNFGKTSLDTVNTLGQTALGQENTQTGQQYTADTGAEQLATARGTDISKNRQATQQQQDQTKYTQGMGADTATAGGAKAVGDARIAGQGAYRAGVTQQQGLAQQGGQTAVGQQIQGYGTQTQGTNTATANRANYENTGPGGLGKMGGQLLGDVIGGAASAAPTIGKALMDEGGVVTEPTMAVVAEHHPEMVIPLGRYRRDQRIAA